MDLNSSLSKPMYADTFIKMCEIYLDSHLVSDDEIEDMLAFMSNFTSIPRVRISFLRLCDDYKNYKENKIY